MWVLGHVQRDSWDWVLYAASLAAALVAVAGLVNWVLRQRRRAEIRTLWEYSTNEPPAGNWHHWSSNHVPSVEPGTWFYVKVSFLNVGDQAGSGMLMNFVVPDCLVLDQASGAVPLESRNPIAGEPPEFRVYFHHASDTWAPGNWVSMRYRIQQRNTAAEPRLARLLLDVADARFNRHGWRYLWNFAPLEPDLVAPAGTKWPPKPEWSLGLRFIRAQPKGEVLCMRGTRKDIREVVLSVADATPIS